jgi:tyrosyl-tRNA synthetase
VTDIFSELKARGLVAVSTDEAALQKALAEESLTYYVGFDPTAPSLHMGNLVQLLTAARLQQAGHNPLALVGGATGLIGDPRMSGERTLNPREVVEEWVAKIRAQVEKFLDFDGPHAAQIVNNLDWTSQLSAIDFLRDIGKHFPVNRMLAKESVSARLNSEAGISFTEFSYQILQGNDYLELNRRYGCSLQTGGSDQWGNLTSGVDLIRRVEQKTVHALATPLITKADGTKFGKTESGTVWLDSSLTSPYAFSQFWLNADDRDVVKYLKVFSLRPLDEIEAIEAEFTAAPHTRVAQKALAEDVTTSSTGARLTSRRSLRLPRSSVGESSPASTLPRSVPRPPSCRAERCPRPSWPKACPSPTRSSPPGIVKSKGEARRAIKDGGAYVNNVKVAEQEQTLTSADVLSTEAGGVVLLRRGKKTLGAVDIVS